MNDHSSSPTSLTYRSAGVDIEQANQLIHHIKSVAKRTHQPGVLAGIGGFGALFELPWQQYQQPVLVSGTDGVGTKLKIATAMQRHDTIGIDLVAMCVNDILTLGAKPLFFLDYFASGHLDTAIAKAILCGIGKGCELAQAALIGGETAEMPGMYQGQDYDLAGFCVGIVEKSKIIDGSQVSPDDAIIGIASSGAHSNGYSLIRRVIDYVGANLDDPFNDQQTLGEHLLTPTRIYTKAIQAMLAEIPVHALAHITGGGLLENIPRVLPQHTQAMLYRDSWEWPALFHWLQSRGNIATEEMLRTFNVGVGMVAIVSAADAEQAIALLQEQGESAWQLGKVITSSESTPCVTISGIS